MRTSRRIVLAGARLWHRWSASPGYRGRVRRTGAVALAVVVGSIIVAKVSWGTRGPSLATPFAFAALFFAAVALLAVAIVSFDEFVDELDGSHPPRVRNRVGFVRNAKRIIRVLAAAINAVDDALIRNVTRESLGQWGRAMSDALTGVPPSDAAPVHAHAGPLARPGGPRASRAAPRGHRRNPRRNPRRTVPARGNALSKLEQLYRQHLPRPAHPRHRERSRSGSRRRA